MEKNKKNKMVDVDSIVVLVCRQLPKFLKLPIPEKAKILRGVSSAFSKLAVIYEKDYEKKKK